MGNIIVVAQVVEHMQDLQMPSLPSKKTLRRLQDGATGAVLMLVLVYFYRRRLNRFIK